MSIIKLSHEVGEAPCNACRAPRSIVIMIPGRNQCYDALTIEYHGYIMAGYEDHTWAYEFVCLDLAPGTLTGDVHGVEKHICDWLPHTP